MLPVIFTTLGLLAASASAAAIEKKRWPDSYDFNGPYALTVIRKDKVLGAILPDSYRSKDTAALGFLTKKTPENTKRLTQFYHDRPSGRLAWNGGIETGMHSGNWDLDISPEENPYLLWAGLRKSQGVLPITFTDSKDVKEENMSLMKGKSVGTQTSDKFWIKTLDLKDYLMFKRDTDRFVLCQRTDPGAPITRARPQDWESRELNVVDLDDKKNFQYPPDTNCEPVTIRLDTMDAPPLKAPALPKVGVNNIRIFSEDDSDTFSSDDDDSDRVSSDDVSSGDTSSDDFSSDDFSSDDFSSDNDSDGR